jgi:peroxiredoxin
MRRIAIALTLLSITACTKEKEPLTPDSATTSQAPGVATSTGAGPATGEATKAEIGKPAPDFALKDLDGKEVRLSSFKGKVIVLEWFNPACPFVKNAHTKGSLKEAAKRHTQAGVVWLAINSGAPGMKGHGVDTNREAAKTFAMEHPVLLDEAGEVGRKYGATNTPHMMVIDESGLLVYRGAIDNSPDGEGESPTGGKLVSYVDAALGDLKAKKPIATTETKAYGCTVKYAK